MRLRCPHCQRTLEVPDSAAGKQVRCPACSTTTRAPEPSASEEPPASGSEAAESGRKSLYSSPPASSPLASPQAAPPPVEPEVQDDERERIACPTCAKMLLVTPELANQIVACPACRARLRMPSWAEATRGASAKRAFGVGMGAEVAPAPTAGSGSVETSEAENLAPGGAASSGWGQSSPAGPAGHPYTTPVGAATAPHAAPAAGHTEPILYVLPGAFQLTMAGVIFIVSVVNLVMMVSEIIDFGPPNSSESFYLLVTIISLLMTSVVIVGSIQMIRRRSLGLARAASILAILPCNVCCVALTPFGIWSTVMLFLPNAPRDFGEAP